MTFTFEDCFVIASRIATARQWFHTWFVVFLKSILSRKGLILEASMIEDCYYFFDFRIQIFERCINAVPQLFDKMCFKIFNMVLYRRFSLGFPCGRRQDDGSIEIFQICKCGLQNQFVLRVLCYSGFQTVSYTHLDVYKRQVVVLSSDIFMDRKCSRRRIRKLFGFHLLKHLLKGKILAGVHFNTFTGRFFRNTPGN